MTVATMTERPDYVPSAAESNLGRWVSVLAPAAQLADRIADTDFVPDAMRGNAAMVTAAIMYGDELGVGPMQALSGINIIKGKPSPSSELMRALVFRAGHSIKILKSDGNSCRIAGKRRDEREPTVIEWSIEMARAAGLPDSNPTWRRYPRAMLLARATSELCRVMFPDVVKGLGHVIDDDTDALGWDSWAASETGQAAPDPKIEGRGTVKRGRRRVVNTALPEPAEDGPQAGHNEPVREPEWPDGVTQPPLPIEPATGDVEPGEIPSQSVTHPADDGSPGSVAAPPPEPLPQPDDNEPARDELPLGDSLSRGLHAIFRDIGVEKDDRAKRLAITSHIVGRAISSSTELTRREGLKLMHVLNDISTGMLRLEVDPNAPHGVAIYPTTN